MEGKRRNEERTASATGYRRKQLRMISIPAEGVDAVRSEETKGKPRCCGSRQGWKKQKKVAGGVVDSRVEKAYDSTDCLFGESA